MRTVTTTALAHSLAETLRAVASGDTVEVTKRGKVVARILPPDERPRIERVIEASRELGRDDQESLAADIAAMRAAMPQDKRAWR